jgi:GR25 family glycosyltransferase involved in LPS biosynthesis
MRLIADVNILIKYMDQIDIFYFINLERRTDRFQEIISELKKMEIPLIKVIHVKALDHKFGMLGCVTSHIWAIRHFITTGKDRCLILEDDFEFTESKDKTNEVLHKIFTSNIKIDCLMLTTIDKGLYISPTIEKGILQKIYWAPTTSAYCITKEYAPRLLFNFNEGAIKLEKWINAFGEIESSFTLDIYWVHEQLYSSFYLTVPKLGKQRDSPSDIKNNDNFTIRLIAKD